MKKMPRRRKSNLSAVSAEAKRARLRRALEDEAGRAKRLMNQRLRVQRSRSLESEEEREYRLFLVRQHSARIRERRKAQSRKEQQKQAALHRMRTAGRRGKKLQKMQERQQDSGVSVGTDAVQKKEPQQEPKNAQKSNPIGVANQRGTKRTDSEQKGKDP